MRYSAQIVRAVVLTTDTSVDLDPDAFVSGRGYFVNVSANLGTPGAASGDSRSTAAIIARGVASSPTFRAQ